MMTMQFAVTRDHEDMVCVSIDPIGEGRSCDFRIAPMDAMMLASLLNMTAMRIDKLLDHMPPAEREELAERLGVGENGPGWFERGRGR